MHETKIMIVEAFDLQMSLIIEEQKHSAEIARSTSIISSEQLIAYNEQGQECIEGFEAKERG
mgnify:CR=1 FL=1